MIALAQTASAHDEVIQSWLAEVLALKPGKRAKWKGVLVNQTGTRGIIRYADAGVSIAGVCTHFVQKLNEERKGKRGTTDDWIPVFSFTDRDTIVERQAKASEYVAVIAPNGARPTACDPRLENVIYVDGVSPLEGDTDDIRHQVRDQMRVNATGNHTARHHAIRVPTGASEPVRG